MIDVDVAHIAPISRTRWSAVRRLTVKKGRENADQFLVDGVQATREALRYGDAEFLIVAEALCYALDHWEPGTLLPPQLRGVAALLTEAARRGVPVVSVTEAEDRQISDAVNPQGIFAVCPRRHFALSEVNDPQLVVICAAVRDPGNAGTIIRAADAFGADVVVFTSDSVEVENAKTVRASVGSLFHLPVIQDVPFETAAAWAKTAGMQLLVADTGGQMLTDVSLNAPTAWVFGNEAWGVTPDILAWADASVSVPMFGLAESLNVAAAAAVCLYATATAK
ncbi:MAG: RNA methyltransferase [Propionibacteriaceae bacterium]|jgi:TrmH family RNA methyltransferase|nr:RNA methyltransferase [Propionibacteriaceae bacterium]